MSTKICIDCKVEQSTDRFFKIKRGNNTYLKSRCKDCYNRKQNAKNRAAGMQPLLTEIEATLDTETRNRLDSTLLSGLGQKKLVAREFEIPYQNLLYYYNRKIKPILLQRLRNAQGIDVTV
jgi:hypothetical protein